MDLNIRQNSRVFCFWMFVLLCARLNSASAQQTDDEIPKKLSSAWDVLFPIGEHSPSTPELSPLRSLQNFKLHGPHADHPFLLGEYETNGEWQLIDGELQSTGGENCLLVLPEADQFDVEGIFSSDRLGGMLILLGWTPDNSGYVLYNVTMKNKESGSPWHLCRMERGRFVSGDDHEVARSEWEGVQSIRLSVCEQHLSLAIGKSRVVNHLPLTSYSPGKVMLGTYNTRYGPKNLRIRTLRIREIPPPEDEPTLSTESSR